MHSRQGNGHSSLGVVYSRRGNDMHSRRGCALETKGHALKTGGCAFKSGCLLETGKLFAFGTGYRGLLA